MDKIFIGTLALFLIVGCKPTNTKTDIKSENLYGAVKSVIEYKEEYVQSLDRVDFHPVIKKVFNKSGFIEQEDYFFYDEKPATYKKYYDSKNYIREEEKTSKSTISFYEFKKYYTFNIKGLQIKTVEMNTHEPQDITSITTKYDKYGNIIEEIKKEIDETNIEKHIYKYGNRNLKLEEKVYDNDEQSSFYKYTYNIDGQCIEKYYHNPNDGPNDYEITQYDYQGNEINYSGFKNGKRTYQDQKTYDGKKNLLKLVHNSIGFSFINEFTYKYDNEGNWIQKDYFVNGELSCRWKREYEYY